MDIFLKELLVKLIISIIYIILYIVLLPFIVLIKSINFFGKNQNHDLIRGRDTHIFNYFPTYKFTKKHKDYLFKIINEHKIDKEFSRKTLLQMIYFSKCFGLFFYYINWNGRLNIKNSFFNKQREIIWFKKYYIDSLDFLWILLEKNYHKEHDLNKFLISIIKYSKYQKIGLFNYIGNIIDLLLLSKIEEVELLDFTITVLNYFKDKEYLFEGNSIQSNGTIDVKHFMERLFYRIELKNDKIVDKTLEVLDFLQTNNEKIDMLLSLMNEKIKENLITAKDINMFKLTLSLLILLNYDIKNYIEKLKKILKEEEFHKIKNYILFYQLNQKFIKSDKKEKIIKI